MHFKVITTDEFNRCDFATMLQFDSRDDAMRATEFINGSEWANTGRLTRGESGAFSVGCYVMCNTYGEDAADHVLEALRKLDIGMPARFGEPTAEPGTASRELFDILESDIESQHDFKEQRAAIDGLIVEYLAATYPEAVFVGSDIDLNTCRKVLHINFDVNNRKYQIRFKAWGCGARSVWVELRGSTAGSVKLENHADLPDIARKLAGTSPKASKAPAGTSPVDRIGQLEARVAELENTIRKLLKK